MIPTVTNVEYLHDYRLRLSFDDGTVGDVDLADVLHGEVFEPLKSIEFFKRVRVDHELATIVWPNGADLAPEFLYERALLDS